jgi:hypothetical protein
LVVTPTLGNSRYLGATIESVRAVGQGIRHVLVAPPARVSEIRTRYPSLEVIAEPVGAGLYGALNWAISTVEGWDWFTYINDDDCLLPGFARVVADHLSIPEQRIAYADVMYRGAQGSDLGLMPTERNPRQLRAAISSGVIPLTQQGTLISRGDLASLGGFDTRFKLAADFDLWVRALAAGLSFRYYNEVAASFRLRPGQLSGNVALSWAEAEASRRLLGRPHAIQRALSKSRFYGRNVFRYMRRVQATGRLRSRALFAAPPP